jgi:hypothetical protein
LINLSKSAEYPGGKPEMVFFSMLTAFGLNLTVNCIYFSTGKWKTKSVVKPKLNLDIDMNMNL